MITQVCSGVWWKAWGAAKNQEGAEGQEGESDALNQSEFLAQVEEGENYKDG